MTPIVPPGDIEGLGTCPLPCNKQRTGPWWDSRSPESQMNPLLIRQPTVGPRAGKMFVIPLNL